MTYLMRMDDILELTSTDYFEPVRQIVHVPNIDDPYHQQLREKMLKDGINRVPIFVDPQENRSWMATQHDILGNGHHRVRIAYEAGWYHMLATDDGEESGLHNHMEGKIY